VFFQRTYESNCHVYVGNKWMEHLKFEKTNFFFIMNVLDRSFYFTVKYMLVHGYEEVTKKVKDICIANKT
jgi:hypothetical protein